MFDSTNQIRARGSYWSVVNWSAMWWVQWVDTPPPLFPLHILAYKNIITRSARGKQMLATAEPPDLHRSHFLCHIKRRAQQQCNAKRAPQRASAAMTFGRDSRVTRRQRRTSVEIETETMDRRTDRRTNGRTKQCAMHLQRSILQISKATHL